MTFQGIPDEIKGMSYTVLLKWVVKLSLLKLNISVIDNSKICVQFSNLNNKMMSGRLDKGVSI